MGAKENISEEMIARYLAGNASATELEEVKAWLNESPEHQEELRAYQMIWAHSGADYSHRKEVDVDKAWQKISREMSREEVDLSDKGSFVSAHSGWRFNYWNAAAVILITCLAGWFIFRQESVVQRVTFASKDQVRELDLPDGSKVFLNHHASISYDEGLVGDERSVVLEGEAFFNVKSDASRPFVVTAAGVGVKVLGTSFNVKSDQSGPVRVDVQEGRVEVSKGEQKVILNKGQSAKVEKDARLHSIGFDQNMLGYHTAVYDFEGSTLQEVVDALSAGYHTTIVLSGPIADCHYTAAFEKKSLESILNIVAETLQLRVSKEGGRYILKGDRCM